MEEAMDKTEITKEEALINAGFRKTTNHENADVYKIFSILYGLVIFIGGVTFSISHAIVSREDAEIIKHLAEIYFTCLYWISIIWIIFCIIDIVYRKQKAIIPASNLQGFNSNQSTIIKDIHSTENKFVPIPLQTIRKASSTSYINSQLLDENEKHHAKQSTGNGNMLTIPDDYTKSTSLGNLSHVSSTTKTSIDMTRDVLIRRRALDPAETQDLRVYVHHRKNSIVQNAIGYNYDDKSIVGGLYTRIGIGIFCLGTVIHAGLSILSNLETRRCTRWTAIMDDFSRLVFSFIQFFFIFKHSNLIIRAHECIARLAVIHIAVTNLCVWFRMVVIETKSQIEEMDGHEIVVAQQNNIPSHFNNNSDNTINFLHDLLFYPSKCSNLSTHGLPVTTIINEGYMKLKPLLYPCTIEFSLMCLTLFYLIWENIGKTFTRKISDKSSTKNVFMINCHASNKGLFGGMFVFSCTMISIILYAVFRNKIGDTHFMLSDPATIEKYSLSSTTNTIGHDPTIFKSSARIDYSIVILEIVNLCLLALSLCATIWSLIKIRKLNYRRTTTRFDDVLIIISLTGIYLYSIFSAFAIFGYLGSSTWVAYVKLSIIILEFIEGTVHALFILLALRKRLRRTNKYNYPAREMITLLITLDLSLWFEKTTTTTKHEANPFQLAFYHVIPWSIIAAIATPLQIFFRFHASVCLSHVWANMYHLPAYQSLTSRS
ncbi:unnamed protein product [Adineta steineri]|uniref:Uncharacterized protein n=1 Tax=Adineta steineri TaxID=433720 RepID=A0A814ZW11_9BILA|nr:unnamed protein product [Adineta steineri]CAF4083518.1 unnamed protein product [Adineta steineri]